MTQKTDLADTVKEQGEAIQALNRQATGMERFRRLAETKFELLREDVENLRKRQQEGGAK